MMMMTMMPRSPDGTLYVDSKGTICTNWQPENGLLEFDNALGFGIKYSRDVVVTSELPSSAWT